MLKKGLIILGLSARKGALRAGKRNAKYKIGKSRMGETFNMGRANYKIFEKPLKLIRNDVKDIAEEYKI